MKPDYYICSHCFEPIKGDEHYSVVENGPLYCSWKCLQRDADHMGWVNAKLILEDADEKMMADRDWLGIEEIDAAFHLRNAIAYVEEQIPEYLRFG